MKKKFASIAVAAGLMATMAATASAETVVTGTAAPTTATTATYVSPTPVITPEDIKPATPMIILTRITPFHFSTTGPAVGWLDPQTVDTTGQVITDVSGNEWREVYTWLGKAWIKVPVTANVVTP
ncbi:hypothetical protein ACE6ED_02440 [Paenibacillus sp. CN-4]|uniref:hypothetical protein n=1 Tax=Paenibacillus nanchangensis TaxID=3348343 RepID=UPI0039796E4A